MLSASQRITGAQHEALLKSAVHVEGRDTRDNAVGMRGPVHTHTVKKKIHVPVEREVKVPVVKKTVDHQTERTVVQGTKMVPVKKFREVQETVIETREEVVHGFREKWVKVREPTTEVVKKEVPVTKTRNVPYIDYVEKVTEHVITVPKEVVTEKRGYRTDKHVGTKVVEVEQDHHYEMRPVYVKPGETRMRDAGYVHHGLTRHGRSNDWDAGGATARRSPSLAGSEASTLAPSSISRPDVHYGKTQRGRSSRPDVHYGKTQHGRSNGWEAGGATARRSPSLAGSEASTRAPSFTSMPGSPASGNFAPPARERRAGERRR